MKLRFLVFMSLAIALPVLADLQATYEYTGGNQMTITYRDDNHIRIQVSDSNYLLVSPAGSYLLSRQGDSWMGMDMNTLKAVGALNGLLGQQADTTGSSADKAEVSFSDTGKTEAIAGYQGRVYQVKTQGRQHEVVLSEHQDIARLQLAMLKLSSRMTGEMGINDANFSVLMDAAEKDGRGVIRLDNTMRLKQVQRIQKDHQLFQLPAGTRIIRMPSFNLNGFQASNDDGMKTVFEADSALEAHMIANLLEQQGIAVWVEGEHLQGGIGELQALGMVRVLVNDMDSAAASEVISAWHDSQPPADVRSVPVKERLFSGFLLGFFCGVMVTVLFFRAILS